MLLLDSSRAPETFVPELLERYLDESTAQGRAAAEEALTALAGARSHEEFLIELLELAPDETSDWVYGLLERCPPRDRPTLRRRLEVLADLVIRAEERYFDPGLLEHVRARHDGTLGDTLRQLLTPQPGD